MAVLEVNTDALRTFAANLDNLANSTGYGKNSTGYGASSCLTMDAKMHTTTYVTLSTRQTGPMYTSIATKTEAMAEDVQLLLSQLGDALSNSAIEIRRTADEYDADDDEAAAEVDAEYTSDGPAADWPRWSEAVYMSTPASAIEMQGPNVPDDQRAFEDYVAEILTTDWLSPTDAANQMIDFFFDYDPVSEVSKNLSGDWNSLFFCASALDSIGKYFQGMEQMIPETASKGVSMWRGNVADSAFGYFCNLGDQCTPWMHAVQNPGNHYRNVANSMKIWADSIGNGMTTIMDAILFAIVCSLGGAALIETVVGAVLGWLAALGSLGVVIYNVHRVTELLAEVYDAIIDLGAVIGTFSQLTLQDGVNFTPPVAYDNELV